MVGLSRLLCLLVILSGLTADALAQGRRFRPGDVAPPIGGLPPDWPGDPDGPRPPRPPGPPGPPVPIDPGWGGGCIGCGYSGNYYGGNVTAPRPAPPKRLQGESRNGVWYY